MRRFDLDDNSQAPSELNSVFSNVPREHADKVLDMFPLRNGDMGSRSSAITVA